MAIDVRIPSSDAPRGWIVALVAAASLSVGVFVAWWGTEPEASATDEVADATQERRGEAHGADSGDASTGSAISAPSPDSAGIVDAGTRAEPRPAPVAAPEPDAGSEDESASPPVEAAPSSDLRVRRGRVAYIRCDGIDDCPRDDEMEAAVWALVETLPACASGPRAPGEADIRLDYRGAGQPEVAWRDTFPSTTVRLEREAVLGCLQDRLTGTRQSLGAERLLVSFRFVME